MRRIINWILSFLIAFCILAGWVYYLLALTIDITPIFVIVAIISVILLITLTEIIHKGMRWK
jgi:hypothetical protein